MIRPRRAAALLKTGSLCRSVFGSEPGVALACGQFHPGYGVARLQRAKVEDARFHGFELSGIVDSGYGLG